MKNLILIALVTLAAATANATIISNSITVDDIEYYVQTDKAVYALGETVEMLFRVTNLGSEILSFGTSYPIIDTIISEKVGETYNEIWNWSWDKIFHLGPVLFTLDPGVPVELSGTWSQINLNDSVEAIDHTQVPAGVYGVSGYFNPTGTSVALDITIVPEPCSVLILGLGALFLRKR